MRKCLLLTAICLIFLWPVHLESKELAFKVSFSLHSGGEWHDVWQQTRNYYGYQVKSEQKVNTGTGFSFELIYMFHPNFGFSLGIENISKSINAGKIRFLPPESSGYVGGFSYAPHIVSDVYPFTISSVFSSSILPGIRGCVFGGIGYYSGTVRCEDAGWEIEEREDWKYWNHLTLRFQSDISKIGFHAGASIDIEFLRNIFLSVDVLYRTVSFKEFSSSYYGVSSYTDRIKWYAEKEMEQTISRAKIMEWDSSLLYARRLLGSEEQGEMDYKVIEYGLTGFSFCAGLKFRF